MGEQVTAFKMIKSHCPNGLEANVRAALLAVSEAHGVVQDVSYQIAPNGEHCCSVVFAATPEAVATIYEKLDHMVEPPSAGTTIRRNV